MADDLERPGVEPERHGAAPHLPSPSIWPFAFAGGVTLVLVGIVVNWWVAVVGAVLALLFGFLWIREVTTEVRRPPVEPPPAQPEVVEQEEELEEEQIERFPRSVFLEGATLGLGALIGGIVTVPALGFMVLPAFVDQGYDDVDLGPLENFPKNTFVTATFVSKKLPEGERKTGGGGVWKRTAFVRNNGVAESGPSFTIISNRCVHLGCPTQPQGPPGKKQTVNTPSGPVQLEEYQASGFGCPCHGGAYDAEGNRTAGPPVRALDRYEYAIREGRLFLGKPYSVASVEGKGTKARMRAYRLADPGQHVDGPEQFFYPFVP